jgi:stage II sporulation protein D
VIRHNSVSFLHKNRFSFLKLLKTFRLLFLLLPALVLLLSTCSPTKRFAENQEREERVEREEKFKDTEESVEKEEAETGYKLTGIRVLLDGLLPAEKLTLETQVFLFSKENKITLINKGAVINCSENYGMIKLSFNEDSYEGEEFFLVPVGDDSIIKINGKKYRGRIRISYVENSLHLVNIINLEDYVKGVLAREMPLGKNHDNYEALKALAVCIRTYTLQKVKNNQVYFDLYDDTRDQVYGGVDAETPLSNKASDETKNLFLIYNSSPALVYYHSTCGGYTESSENVFTKEQFPYLSGVKDGSDPYCRISPRFEWKETYSKELIISRLKSYSLLDNLDYKLDDISVLSRFNSGRVNELEIEVISGSREKKSIIIKGNEIRNIIRTADGKNILWGTMFDISMKSGSVILTGKGFGHGVGLCQWGAIALSRKGWSFGEILSHYFPGTNTAELYDQN